MTEIYNFADDTTLYTCDGEIKSVIRKLEHETLLAIEWFGANYMKLNEDKCHFFAGHKHEVVFAMACGSQIWESTCEKLLGVYLKKIYHSSIILAIFVKRPIKSCLFDKGR